LTRRKEKPLVARTIVLIVRKRGGWFLKKEGTGNFYYEDAKAEVKTAQAVRQGLDVRVTMSAASSLLDKKKKTGSGKDMEGSDLDLDSPRNDGSYVIQGRLDSSRGQAIFRFLPASGRFVSYEQSGSRRSDDANAFGNHAPISQNGSGDDRGTSQSYTWTKRCMTQLRWTSQ
jgi:hypothetical protein